MKLYKLLDLNLDKLNIISVVGGGGKTTSIKKLAKELSGIGKKVLITTSTGISIPNKDDYVHLFIKTIPLDYKPSSGTIDYYGELIDNIKLKTKDISIVDEIINRNIYDIVLIEADGSKGMPIKAPAAHEPVISELTTMTIGVIGLESLGMKVTEENVHRPEIFIKLTDSQIVDIEAVINLVQSKNGTFKNSLGKKILLLNKADDDKRIKLAIEIRETLKGKLSFRLERSEMEKLDIIIADVKSNKYVGE